MGNYCEDCGCKVYNGKCTNCHEKLYILEQYDELEMDYPKENTDFMKKVIEQQKELQIIDNTFIKVENIEDIKKPNIRLFYELGEKLDIRLGVDNGNWKRSGLFKEIKDIEDFVLRDVRLNDVDYINHHNFHTKPKH